LRAALPLRVAGDFRLRLATATPVFLLDIGAAFPLGEVLGAAAGFRLIPADAVARLLEVVALPALAGLRLLPADVAARLLEIVALPALIAVVRLTRALDPLEPVRAVAGPLALRAL
jgi:hypothetical protein